MTTTAPISYDTVMAALKSRLEAHNGRLPAHIKKLEVQGILDAVMVQGGTDMDTLREFSAADFTACGFPTALAGAARTMIAGPPVSAPAPVAASHGQTAAQTIVVRNVDIEAEMADASEVDLLARYNHDKPGRIGVELTTRAKGMPFLGFAAGVLDQAASLKRLQKIMKNKRVGDTMTLTDGQVVRPHLPGDLLVDEPEVRNPLFPDLALLDDMECERTGESWEGIDREVMQLLVIEAQRPGGRPWGSNVESARAVITAARLSNASIEFKRRYKDAAVALSEMPSHEREALLIASRITSSSTSREATRGLPFASESPWADARPGAMRTMILASHSDKKYVVELTKHLTTFVNNGQITLWHADKAVGGSEDSTVAHIGEADAVLVMVSADFLAEQAPTCPLLRATKTLKDRGGIVVPVLVRPSTFAPERPTWWLEKLMALPRSGRAISQCQNRHEVMAHISDEVLKVVDIFAKNKPQRLGSSGTVKRAARSNSVFEHETVLKLSDACIQLGITAESMTLGLDRYFTSSIASTGRQSDDVHAVLDAANRTPSLIDGTVPMRTVLLNCIGSSTSRREGEIFSRCMELLAPAQHTEGSQFTLNVSNSNMGAISMGNNVVASYRS